MSALSLSSHKINQAGLETVPEPTVYGLRKTWLVHSILSLFVGLRPFVTLNVAVYLSLIHI